MYFWCHDISDLHSLVLLSYQDPRHPVHWRRYPFRFLKILEFCSALSLHIERKHTERQTTLAGNFSRKAKRATVHCGPRGDCRLTRSRCRRFCAWCRRPLAALGGIAGCHCLCCHCWNSTNKIFANRQHIYATLSRICKYQFSNMENQSKVKCETNEKAEAASLWSNTFRFVYIVYYICYTHILKLFPVELFWLQEKYFEIYWQINRFD